jgi:hypothetical protein
MRKVLLEVNFACGAGSVTKLVYRVIRKELPREIVSCRTRQGNFLTSVQKRLFAD